MTKHDKTAPTHLVVIGHDNRGSSDYPFGYVYLGRIKSGAWTHRVGYGSTRDNREVLAIWPCRETPDDMTSLTLLHIQQHLEEAFPHLVGVVHPEPGQVEVTP